MLPQLRQPEHEKFLQTCLLEVTAEVTILFGDKAKQHTVMFNRRKLHDLSTEALIWPSIHISNTVLCHSISEEAGIES